MAVSDCKQRTATSATACRVVKPGTRPVTGSSTGSPRMEKLVRSPGRRMVHGSPEARTYASDRVFSCTIGMTPSTRNGQRTKNGAQLSPAPALDTRTNRRTAANAAALAKLMTPSPSTMRPSRGTQRSPRVQITAWQPAIARRQSSGDKALPSTTSTGPSDAARRASRVRTRVAIPRSPSRRTTNRPQPPVAPATRTFMVYDLRRANNRFPSARGYGNSLEC
jgi:hypothetical protein